MKKWIKELFCKHNWKIVSEQRYSIFSDTSQVYQGSVKLTIYECDKCCGMKIIPSDRRDRNNNQIY